MRSSHPHASTRMQARNAPPSPPRSPKRRASRAIGMTNSVASPSLTFGSATRSAKKPAKRTSASRSVGVLPSVGHLRRGRAGSTWGRAAMAFSSDVHAPHRRRAPTNGPMYRRLAGPRCGRRVRGRGSDRDRSVAHLVLDTHDVRIATASTVTAYGSRGVLAKGKAISATASTSTRRRRFARSLAPRRLDRRHRRVDPRRENRRL